MRRALSIGIAAALALPQTAALAEPGKEEAASLYSTEIPDVEKPGDDQLTCEQLTAEAATQNAEIEAITKETEKLASAQAAGMAAKQQAGNMAGRALSGLASALLPGVGGLIGAGVDALSSAATKPNDPGAQMMKKLQPVIERQTYAAERLRHVQMLYMDKCMDAAAPAGGATQPQP